MARPRQFDEDAALDAAIDVFWSRGYQATSTEQLCEATGLGRSSIYNTFTSKHDLFVKALTRYTERTADALLEVLERDTPIRRKLRDVFALTIDEDAENRDGCLVVNAAIELSPHDRAVDTLLRRDHQRRLSAIRAAIDAAKRSGEIDPDRDSNALAEFVTATTGGMRVASRAGADRTVLTAIADTAVLAI
jgi:TetR/AcrR family transcriptional repressor of nem operon